MVRLFDPNADETIRKAMKKWGHRGDRYSRISELLPQFTSKQIGHHWNDELNPRLNHDTLSDKEKRYIDKWVRTNRRCGMIQWKYCQRDMETAFGKFHSTNKIKNSWYAKQKRFGPDTMEPFFQPDPPNYPKLKLSFNFN